MFKSNCIVVFMDRVRQVKVYYCNIIPLNKLFNEMIMFIYNIYLIRHALLVIILYETLIIIIINY